MRASGKRVVSKWIAAALVVGVMALGACSDGGGEEGEAAADRTTTTAASDDSASEPVVTACERVDGDAVSFAAGEAFSADLESATERTCRYPRDSAGGDSITLTVSATTLDPVVQLDALATSPASAETFQAVDLGEGAFTAVIDDKPRAGVFVDGELVEVVLVVTEPLGITTPPEEVLLTILGEATGQA